MLNGIILAVLEDMGPASRVNISHLSELESMKLSVAAMTAVGLGNDTSRQRRNLYGTFPVANRDEYRALVFPFSVSGEKSADNRVRHFGRECSIFLLFNREFRGEVFNNFAKIERLLREETDPLYSEDQLTEIWIKRIYTGLNELFKTTVSEEEDINKITFSSETKEIIAKITACQEELSNLLSEIGVGFMDNPILSTSFEPNVATLEQENSVFNKGNEYVELINNLNKQSKIAARHYVDVVVLEKLGHYFYWNAIRTNSKKILEEARLYYEASLRITGSALMILTLGSVDTKLVGSDAILAKKVKEELKEGFGKFDRRLKLSRKVLFAKSLEDIEKAV